MRRIGLRLNGKKTEVMSIGREQQTINIRYTGESLNQVEEFVYLGAQSKSTCTDQEARRRISMAKTAAGSIKDVWQCRSISTKMKRRLVETLLWSTMSYGSWKWIFNKSLMKQTAAFETWCYGRILKISWQDFVSNEEVYRRAATKPRLCQLLLA